MLISNILNALEGQKLQFSKGDQIWDFLYMGDVADALLHIARRGKNGAVYPIGSGKARPLSEYIRILCEKLGKLDEMELGGIPYSDRQIMHCKKTRDGFRRWNLRMGLNVPFIFTER